MRLREYCDIQAKGRGLYTFINAVRESALLCEEQRCSGEVFCCRIRACDLREFEALAQQCGITCTVKRRRSWNGKARRYRWRIGIPIGLILGFLLILYQSNIVETIDIQGNEAAPDSVILSLLAQEGVTRGTWIPSINMALCEDRIRSAVPSLSWVGMRHTGNRLVVEVRSITPKIDPIQERAPCNIVAACDAQITGVTVRGGHLQRLIGDGVKKGDLLVSGVIQEEGRTPLYVHANASITGIYTKTASLSEPLAISETAETGRSVTQRWLRIFGVSLPLTVGKPHFAETTFTEQEVPLSLFSHELPVSIRLRITQETETRVTLRTGEEARLALNAAVVRYEKNYLKNVAILDRTLDYSVTEAAVSCRLTYQVEGEIGEEKGFYLSEE